MRKLLIYLAASAIVASCSANVKTKTGENTLIDRQDAELEDTVLSDGDGELASYFDGKDEKSRSYKKVAGLVWRYWNKHTDVYANDYNKMRPWHKKCEKELVRCFDSKHPGSTLSDYAKADSMLNDIEWIMDADSDMSTAGMINSLSVEISFNMYRIAAEYGQILSQDKGFADEIKAWKNLNDVMQDFCSGVVATQWFGGSGSGPAVMATKNGIYENRLEDLYRIRKDGQSSEVKASGDVASARSRLLRVVKETFSKVLTPADMKDDFMAAEIEQGYKDLYDEIKNAEARFEATLDKWLDTRNGYRSCTVKALEDMINMMSSTMNYE